MRSPKKIPALLLAGAMAFAAAAPSVIAQETTAAELDPLSPYLVEDNILILDGRTTAREVLTNVINKNSAAVTSSDGTALTGTDPVGTGAKLTGTDKEYTLIVPGDVNGDAKINARDVIAEMQMMLAQDASGDVSDKVALRAADVGHNGKFDAKDILHLMYYMVGYSDAGIAPKTPAKAEHDDPSIRLCFDSVLHRVSRENTDPSDKNTYTAYLAKNELEDVQFIIASENSGDGYTVEVSPLTNAAGKTLPTELRYVYYFSEGYYHHSGVRGEPGTDFPDPIPLYNGESIKLEANESRAFVVQTNTLDTTVDSGMYHSTVTLRDKEGKAVKRGEFSVYVWDFALDEQTYCETALGIGGVTNQYYKERCDLFIDYRLAPYALPYDILDERADEYMSNPRLSSFSVIIKGYGGQYFRTEDEVVTAYDKIRTNPEWLRKAYIYPEDEPWRDEQFEELKRYYNEMCLRMPQKDWELICPVSSNEFYMETKTDRMSRVIPFVTILCPQIYAYRDYVPFAEIKANPDYYKDWNFYLNWQDARSFPYLGNYSERAAKLVAEGTHRAWWYTCDAPGSGPMCDFYIDFQGARHRLFFWHQYANDIDGFLYWATAMMVNDASKRVTASKVTAGDGLWMYIDADWLPQATVPGLRLESIRDGVEDFQYFTQLEKLMESRDAAMEYVKRIITNIHVYDEDPDNIEAVRNDLGFYMEELYKNK